MLRLPAAGRHALFSVATGIGGQLALLVSGVAVARALGVENRGHAALLILWPSVLSQLAALGLPAAITAAVAEGPGGARSVARRLRRVVALQLAAASAVHVAILYLTVPPETDLRMAALLTLPSCPAMLLHQYGLAILQGQRRFAAFNAARMLQVTLYAAACAIAFLFGSLTVPAVAAIWSMATVLASATCLWLARHEPGRPIVASARDAGDLVRFGLRAFLGTVSPTETLRLDQLYIGLFLPPRELGLYTAAIALCNLPKFIGQSVGIVAYPHVAAQPDPTRRWRLAWAFVALGAVLTLAAVGVLLPAVGWLIPFFFGAEFEPAVAPSRLLLLAACLLAVRRVAIDVVKGVGRPGVASASEIVLGLCLVVLVAPATVHGGLMGVAWALLVSCGVSTGALLAAAFRLSRVRPAPAPAHRHAVLDVR